MAPLSRVTSAPRKSVPSSQPTLAQVGQLAESAQRAAAKVKDLKAELKAADTAFKANPKNAVLGAKVQKLLEQTKAAMAAQEKAAGALSTAVASLVGPGTPRQQAAALSKLLPKLERELIAAGKTRETATAQLNRDVAAAEATRVGTPARAQGLAKAEASLRKATEAAKAVDQLAAAKAALETAISGKESQALEQARAANVPGSTDVMDLDDLASKTREEQVRLVGAPVVGVSREAAVAADVERIRLAMARSPESAARMLKMQLEGADSSQQSALLRAAAPLIKQMVLAAQGQPQVAAVLLDSVKQTARVTRAELARMIADGTPIEFSPVVTQLQARLEKGEGLVEAVALRDAFKASKPGVARAIDAPLTAKVNALEADFAEKGEKVKKLNTDLARLVVGFGPLLPPEKRQAAIEGFKAKHQEAYAAWEAAGARLAPAVQYALEGNDPKLEQLLPDFLATRAGEASMMQALALQAEGKPSLLDRVPELVKQANEGAKLAGHVSTALAKGVGKQVLDLTRDGKLVEAQALLHSLERNAGLFGVSAEAMEKLTGRMSDVLKGGGKDAVKALTQEFQDVETSVPGFEGRRGQALKGLGLALSAVAVVDKLGKFDDLSIKDQMSTIAEGLGVGVDGGLLAMEVFGASSASKLLMLGKSVSAATGAVAAVMDGISAVEAFREGKHAEGVASSASAVGGAILATAAFTAAAGAQAVPVAGQVVGAVLVVGGTIAKWALESRAAQKAEDRIEADANAFLQAGGVSPRAADALDDLLRKDGRNIGPLLQQMAKSLNMEPEAFFKHLVKDENAAKLKKYVEWTKDFPVDSRGQFKRTGEKSIEVALIWLREDGLMPPGK